MQYNWPGNVRELENAMNRAMVIDDDGILDKREALTHALDHHDGNVTQAAKSLNIAKSTFYRRLTSKTNL